MNVIAPWTDDQVAALERWQTNRFTHPFTCPNYHPDRVLKPTRDGWICPHCDYKQNWAHKMMLGE